MNLKLGHLVGAIFAVAIQSYAATTNTWDITNAAGYYISPADSQHVTIDTTNGVAKLALQTTIPYRATLGEYSTNGSSLVNVDPGPDVSVSLVQSGSTYQASGSYVSRIMDGGTGNLWQRLFSQVSGRQVTGNSRRQTRGDLPGLKALYHLDNSWIDVVSGGSLTNSGGFTNSAMIGSASARFSGGYASLTNSTLLNGATSCTVACWVRFRAKTAYGGILFSRGTVLNGLVQNGFTDQRWGLQCYVKASSGQGNAATTSLLDTNQWYFVAGTWSADAPIKLYLNGKLEGTSAALSGTIQQDDVFRMAWDDFSGTRMSQCDMDEVAILDRALTEAEILDLYRLSHSCTFQLRSGSSPAAVEAKEFTGPDGTTNSHYVGESEILATTGSLNLQDRYIQYKGYLYSDMSNSTSPWIDAVALSGDKTTVYDNTLSDYKLGAFYSSTTNYTGQSDTPYVGLAVRDNGGLPTNGTYVSGIFAAPVPVTWEYLGWEENTPLSASTPGLVALYHMDFNWADSQPTVGGDNSGTADGNPFADSRCGYPKFGSGCSSFFDGASSVTSFGLTSLVSLEFWLWHEGTSDRLMLVGTNGGLSFIAITNGFIVAEGFRDAISVVYVNGTTGSRRILPGWNHVAISFNKAVPAGVLTVGFVNGDYMFGMLDEMAIYNRELSGGEVKSHYLLGREGSGGAVSFQYRAAATEAALSGAAWSSELNDSGAISTNGKFFQYRAMLRGDNDSTPAFRNAYVRYFDGESVTMRDSSRDDFLDGNFGVESSRWYGDEVKLVNQSAWGPANLPAAYDPAMRAVWHLDEGAWGAVSNGSAAGGLDGVAYGNAFPTADSKVGLRCAAFDGSNDYLLVGAPTIDAGDFTVGAWFKSSATNRAALVSTYGGGAHYTIEHNGNGVTTDIGRVAFVLNDGTTQAVAMSIIGDLNDGRWHHVAGVREGETMHLYVDGDRVRSTPLGVAFGSVGSGSPYIGRYGNMGLQCDFKGFMDEVVVFTRALSDAEAGRISGSGFMPGDQGVYTSEPIDAGTPTAWATLSWGADAPYGRRLSPAADATLVALWSFESNTTDSAGSCDATLAGNATYTGSGRLGAGLLLDGTNDWANVTDAIELEPSAMTIEAWVYMSAIDGRIIVDKSNGSTLGYRLATDAQGYPYFRAGALECKEPSRIMRKNAWTHLAGMYGPLGATLFVNGVLGARVTGAATLASSSDLRIGTDSSGNGDFAGRIDEVALHGRPMYMREIFDHYKAGAMTMKLQARAADDTTTLAASPWVGPAGVGGYFTYSKGESLTGIIPVARYFQYRVLMSTEDHHFTPKLQGVKVDASGYSTNNPAVEVATGYGLPFPGNLTSFNHVLKTNTDAAVRYQLSGNNGTNWHCWWSPSNMWMDAATLGGGYDCANPKATINANIGTFYRQMYEKTGGILKWRAFLHSGGSDQVELDSVSVGYSEGRVVLTAPNGAETNKDAWLVGTTNTITWVTAGAVPGTASIRYSTDGGSNWVDVPGGTGIVASSGTHPWVTPGVESTNCLARITHDTDPTVLDTSDGPFQLIKRYRVLVPNGGETWYVGETNTIVWGAAAGLGSVNIDYCGNGNWTNPIRVATVAPSTAGSMANSYIWVIPATNPALPSATAAMRVQTPGGSYADYSDNFFTMAGVVITAPANGQKIKKDASYNIAWQSAGCGSGVMIELQSLTGGPWITITNNAANVDGTNVFQWFVTNAPTEEARLRITSLTDPRAKGQSGMFTIAALEVASPRGHPDPNQSEKWLMNTTQAIAWVSAGASAFVNLHYSTNDGVSWTEIANGWPNSNGAGVTNYYQWVIPNDPSPGSRIRVQDSEEPVNLWSMSPYNFHLAGIKVTWPNGPVTQEWVKGASGMITWKHNAVGNNCTVELSDDGGITWTNVAGMGATMPLIDEAAPPFTPQTPTVRGLVRITPDLAGTPFSNVSDQSDSYFTVAGVKVLAPTGGVVFTIGTTNTVTFRGQMPNVTASNASIYVSPDGINYDSNPVKLDHPFDGETYPGESAYSWVVEPTRMPSINSRIKVEAGPYSHVSQPFAIRGMRFNAPTTGTVWSAGERTITWSFAALSVDCVGDLYLSTEGNNPPAWTNRINTFASHVIFGGHSWTIPADIEPTTNAAIRYVVTNSTECPGDIGYEAFSRPFTLKGTRVMDPAYGVAWSHGSVCTIRWKSIAAGDSAVISYSADGGSNYAGIAGPIASTNGINEYNWTIDSGRMPSTNAVIKIEHIGGTSAVSRTFTLQGLKVTRPDYSDTYVMTNLTNMIRWTSTGDQGPFDLYYIKAGVQTNAIQSGVAGCEWNWNIPSNAISSNVSILVAGAVFAGTSDVFRVVATSTPCFHQIFSSAGAGGAITPTGTVQVLQGDSTGYVVQAGAQYHIADVSVDGAPASLFGPGSNSFSYSFLNVTTSHTITASFNTAPLLSVVVSQSNGPAPLRIVFDFTGSSDPDNNIVRSEVDRKGDGDYECAADGKTRMIVEYAMPGVYTSQVRVVDGFGLAGSTSIVISVSGATPIAVPDGSPTNGPAPLTVNFSATNSSPGIGRQLVVYEWDFNGDRVFDRISTNGSAAWTYGTAGTNDAILRVTDNNGLRDEAILQIVVGQPILLPPVVTLSAEPEAGNIPLDVVFTAGFTPGSTNAAAFRWDFDGDGACDLVTTAGIATQRYTAAGTFAAAVEAIDKNDLSSTATATVTANESSRLKAWLVSPKAGDRVRGSDVTVHANATPGGIVQSVQLQFKLSASSVWLNLNGLMTPPPHSFKTTWDTTLLTDHTDYDLRALAWDAQAAQVTSEVVTVNVESGAGNEIGDTYEGEVGGRHTKEQKVGKDETTSVGVYDGTEVTVPAGAVESNVTVEVVLVGANTNGVNGSANGLSNVGANRRISLEGNPELELPLLVTIPYPDANNDGLVDGSGAPENTLSAHWFDTTDGKWKRAMDAEVYPDANCVKLKTYHLTEFGLFGTRNLLHPAAGGILAGFTSQHSNTVAAANLADGNIVSYWQSEASPARSQEFTYAFTNCQGAIAEEIALCNYGQADVGLTNYSRDFVLWTSMDGSNYSKACEGTLAASEGMQSFVLGCVTCRTVRLVVTSGVSAVAWDLAEFELHGSLTNDADADLMPDSWENQYFGHYDRTGNGDFDDDEVTDKGEHDFGSDPTDWDTDDDGASDRDEMEAGTGPTDSQSVFKFRKPEKVKAPDDLVILSWPTVTGRWYRLWSLPTLTNDWTNIGNPVEGDGTPMIYTNNCAGEQLRYFRVSVSTNQP